MIRTLFSIFLSAFILAGCVSVEKKSSYEIDSAATAKASLEVGGVIMEGKRYFRPDMPNLPYERRFIGVTTQGQYLVQEYYQAAKKVPMTHWLDVLENYTEINGRDTQLTNPFILTSLNSVYFNYPEVNSYIDGEYSIWYRDAKIESMCNYRNGKREGLRTAWYENGQKSSEYYYRDDKPDGAAHQWYPDGKKRIKGQHQDGKSEGLWTWWHNNGHKSWEGRYLNGKQEWLWTRWDEKGKKTEEVWYEKGLARSPRRREKRSAFRRMDSCADTQSSECRPTS